MAVKAKILREHGVGGKLIRDYGILAVLLMTQMCFVFMTRDVEPKFDMLPEVPTRAATTLWSFGDDQFYFRMHAFDLQVAGWTYGRSLRLESFDYDRLYRWFKLLDVLDGRSDHIPYIASYWYGRSSRDAHVRRIIDYLYERAILRPEQEWRWLAEAVYLADFRLNDADLSLKISLTLRNLRGAPLIIRELPAFIYEKRGEFSAAREEMEHLKTTTQLAPEELFFINNVFERRLKYHDARVSYFATRRMRVGRDGPLDQAMRGNPDYSEKEIRAMSVDGFKVGMKQEEATRVLAKQGWIGSWHPFVDSSFEYPFEKDGRSIWLYRVKGKNNHNYIWQIVEMEAIVDQHDFGYLSYVMEQRYGKPSEMHINPRNGAYLYYITGKNGGATKFEIDIGKKQILYSITDSVLLRVSSGEDGMPEHDSSTH